METKNYDILELNISKSKLDSLPSDISRYTNLHTLVCNKNNLTFCVK